MPAVGVTVQAYRTIDSGAEYDVTVDLPGDRSITVTFETWWGDDTTGESIYPLGNTRRHKAYVDWDAAFGCPLRDETREAIDAALAAMCENFALILDQAYAARDIPRLLAEATTVAINLTNAAAR